MLQPSHNNINFQELSDTKTCKIFHEFDYSSAYFVYLMESTLKQCVGKAETSFNIKVNNHRNDVKNISMEAFPRKKIITSINKQTNLPTQKNPKKFCGNV